MLESTYNGTDEKNTIPVKPLGELNRNLGKTYNPKPVIPAPATPKPSQVSAPTTKTGTDISAAAPVTDPSTAITAATPATIPDMNTQLGTLYDSELQAREAAIRQTTDSAAASLAKALQNKMSELAEAQSGVKDLFYQKKNEAASRNDIGALNFAQGAAARGIKGNSAMLPELYRNVGLQNNLGQLNTQEAQTNAGFARDEALARGQYETDLNSLLTQQDLQILEAGGQISAEKTRALYDQMLRDSQTTEEEKNLARQDWLNTMGRFYGKEQPEIDRILGDGDSSNDWQAGYLQSALAERMNAARTGSYRGGSGGSNYSFSQLDDQVSDMVKNGSDDYGLFDGTAEGIYNYLKTYGGQYADQLIAKWLPGYQANTTQQPAPTSTGPDNKAAADTYIQGLMKSVGAQGFNVNQIEDTLVSLYNQGRFTENDIAYILSVLGL